MTREAFENAIVVNSAIGGSTNAPIHLNAIAAHLGVELDNDDWERIGHAIPLLVDMQPAGRFLGEDYHRAGGVPAVVAELMEAGLLPHPEARHRQRQDDGRELRGQAQLGPRGDPRLRQADREGGGLPEPQGQPVRLRDHEDERDLRRSSATRYLSNPDDPDAFEGTRRRLRRARGLSRAHQRSRARHRREHASSSSAAPGRSAIRAARRW